MIVKVCGLRYPDNIREVESCGPDWTGFIFFRKSPRFAGDGVPSYLPEKCRRVGVFVDSPLEEILVRRDAWGLEIAQLHGDESPGFCQDLRERGMEVIKVFRVGDGLPGNIGDYEDAADHFLFDTSCKGYGGSGKSFDWSVLASYDGKVPFLLSGGIGPGSIPELERFSHPMCEGIDLNSRFEVQPGLKDAALIKDFIEKYRTI